MSDPRTRHVIYVDVDDTLVRSSGNKRIPIPAVVQHVKKMSAAGMQLYCWSSGGAEYAEQIATELGIRGCFAAFLPKPNVFLDDQSPSEWKYARVVGPLDVASIDVT
jgi:predicted HAD superfamily phosphohydrolase YqeG